MKTPESPLTIKQHAIFKACQRYTWCAGVYPESNNFRHAIFGACRSVVRIVVVVALQTAGAV